MQGTYVDGAPESSRFWHELSTFVDATDLVIDRPKGSRHPRYPEVCYPLDYGYLRGTTSGDGEGLDVWVGSLSGREVTGVVCTIDRIERDVEVKVLLGCTPDEMALIHTFHNRGGQSAVLVRRVDGR